MLTSTPTLAMLNTMAAFPLSLSATSRILGMSADDVTDLVRMRVLGAYWAPAPATDENPPLRFVPEEVEDVTRTLLDPATKSETVELHAIARGLRAYLAAHPPASRRGDAVRRGRPLLATSHRGLYAHIKLPVLTQWLGRTVRPGADGELGRLVRTRISTVVADALVRLDAERVRGIRPADEAKPVYDWWWRLPHSLWRQGGHDVADMPVFASRTHAASERVRTDAGGSYVVAPQSWPGTGGAG